MLQFGASTCFCFGAFIVVIEFMLHSLRLKFLNPNINLTHFSKMDFAKKLCEYHFYLGKVSVIVQEIGVVLIKATTNFLNGKEGGGYCVH